jgi:hypothetical protein
VQQVKSYGVPLSAVTDIRLAGLDEGKIWVETGSGTYQFEVEKQ